MQKKSVYDDDTINLVRKKDTNVRTFSTTLGWNNIANGQMSHAIGQSCEASGDYSLAEG